MVKNMSVLLVSGPLHGKRYCNEVKGAQRPMLYDNHQARLLETDRPDMRGSQGRHWCRAGSDGRHARPQSHSSWSRGHRKKADSDFRRTDGKASYRLYEIRDISAVETSTFSRLTGFIENLRWSSVT
ncbi:hypothetical protein BGZ63DRAFT_82165 [Mariannaea sp. PMI_226]|nr:hypothetical protein BGZ63DRAFT_82165 [Mariannaea sp. PMI_226]